MDSKTYLIKVFRIFLITSLPVTLVVALLLGLIIGFRPGLFIVAPLIGTLLGMFAGFHLTRDLKTESFEINQQNKDSQKGLSWYEEAILDQLRAERYIETEKNGNKRVFTPNIRAQVMGGNVELEVNTYWITVTGPRGFIRILASTLDIKKIFL
jgi:hypothetical protein